MPFIKRVLVAAALLASSLVAVNVFGVAPASAGAGSGSVLRPSGYWMAANDGGIFSYGAGSNFYGSAAGTSKRAVIAVAPTVSRNGYWMAATDGGVFSFGDAAFYGSTGAIRLNQPIVGMAATPTGKGYWLVARDGGIFSFGDAIFAGSTGAIRLNQPIVGMAATPSGLGYWLVAADGGIFSFGDAKFYGSAGTQKLGPVVVAMAATASGNGYWMVTRDGAIFAYGDAAYYGAANGKPLASPITSMAATPSGAGYYLVAGDGGVFSFGDAVFLGSAGNLKLRAPVVGIAAVPKERNAETSIFYYPWYSNVTTDGGWGHWEQNGHTPPEDIGANFMPERGAYSSSNAATVDAHMTEIAAMGVTTVVSSWWGRGSKEDERLALVKSKAAAHGLKVAVHIEPYTGRTATSVASDYAYLLGLGIKDFYVYQANLLSSTGLRAANDSMPADVRTWGESGTASAMTNGTFAAFAADAGFTGVYSYSAFFGPTQLAQTCGTARVRYLLCSPSVAPGWDARRATKITSVIDRQAGAVYDTRWAGAIASGGDVVSITSYNEWHEGTQIEPAVAWCWANTVCYSDYVGAYGEPDDSRAAYVHRTSMWTSRLIDLFGV